MNHDSAVAHVQSIALAFYECNSNTEKTAKHLSKKMFGSRSHIELRIEMVSTAFGWALLKKMGINNFPSTFVLKENEKKTVTVAVSESHVFTAALAVAVDIFTNGYNEIFTKEIVGCLCKNSADVDAVNKALNADQNTDLGKAKLHAPVYHGYSKRDFDKAA